MTQQMSQTSPQLQTDKGSDKQMLDRMLSLSQSALLTLNPQYRILDVSPSIEQMLGYEHDAIMDTIYTDRIAEAYLQAFLTLMKRDDVATLDYPLVTASGKWCWVRHTSEKTQAENGDTCIYVMLQCINQYKTPRDSIEQERNLLRMVIDDLPAAIYARDVHGNYIFSNAAHAKLMNRARPVDIIGAHIRDVLPAHVLEHVTEEDNQVMQTGKTLQSESLFIWDENHPNEGKWLDTTKMPMVDTHGNIEGVIGIARDVSEQKRAQQQLEASEARHRKLLDALPDMMFVVNKDGIITEYRATPEVESLEIDESIVGTRLENSDFPRPFIDEARLYLDLALETQYIQSFEFSDAKITPDMLSNPLDVRQAQEQQPDTNYYEARLINLTENEVLALVRNISPLKRVQDELSNHIQDLNLVRQVNNDLSASVQLGLVADLAIDSTMRLSNAHAGYLAIADEEGRLTSPGFIGAYDLGALNRALLEKQGVLARVWNTKAPELIRDVSQDPDYVPLLDDTQAMIVMPLLSSQRIVGILTLESRKAERFSDAHFQFLQLITGRIAAFLENASLHEKTQTQVQELQELYDEVRNLEQIKTDMIRMASHDLKNPLSTVMGYLDFLREKIEGRLTEKEQEYVEKIATAAQSMEELIGSILNLERIQQLSEEQALENVDFVQLAQRSVFEQMDDAVRKNQTLTFTSSEKKLLIKVDPIQLREAIANLVSNAVKYTPPKGTIKVTLGIDDDEEWLQLRVIDNGYGIPKDKQERLFSPFYRVETDESLNEKGSGLGLHLVQNIIERHRGHMYFESDYKKGSTFGFDLPLEPYNPLDETREPMPPM